MAWWRPSTWRWLRQDQPLLQTRSYEGAGRGRRLSDWTTSGASANAEVGVALSLLRERSRDLIRNNPYAAAAVRALVVNIVSPTGITPQCKSPSATVNATAQTLWRRWSRECNVGPDIGMGGLQTLAVRSWLESGEVMVRRRRRRLEDDLAVPLKLQVLEADQLDSTVNSELRNGGRVVQGVELSPLDEIAAYHLHRVHPGESIYSLQNLPRNTQRILADNVAHLYEPARPGQLRGVPVLAPGMKRFRELDSYEDAELVRKRVEACVAAVVTSDEEAEEGIAGKVTDADGNIVETLEPGLVMYARGGKSVAFTQPHSVGGYGEYKRSELQSIAAAVGLTYELLSGDLSKVNYSSIRAGLIEFRNLVKLLRNNYVLPLLMDKVWRWFIEAAVAAGELPAPIEGRLLDFYEVAWSEPRFESVDRLKEAQADLAELLNGTTSFVDLLTRKGQDYMSVLADIAEAQEQAEAAGVKLAWMQGSTPAPEEPQEDAGDDSEEEEPQEDPEEEESPEDAPEGASEEEAA